MKKLSSGVAHKLPKDLEAKLLSYKNIPDTWNNLTPLARNEWICWVTSAVKPETREKRTRRTIEELMKGKRRPCCWAGCVHR